MKILVLIKRVIDSNRRIFVKPDGSGMETARVKMSMNPLDEIAIEEALRLKEGGWVSEVLVVTIGITKCKEALRAALAMGADRGYLVKTKSNPEPLAVAKLLRELVHREQAQLVIMGDQVIDDDCSQTGHMLAELLDWPLATFASKVTISGEQIHVTREIDGGLELLEMTLPALLTAGLSLNEPRSAKLPGIMNARKKPLAVLSPSELGVDMSPKFEVVRVGEPAMLSSGTRGESVDAFLKKLRRESMVI